jgi:hypothetical protein
LGGALWRNPLGRVDQATQNKHGSNARRQHIDG